MWRIYYDDGSTFDWLMGEPHEAPPEGVLCIVGYLLAENGEPVCPTDKCGAFCCKTQSCFPHKPGPCEFLMEDLRCYLHVNGGRSCKPRGCNDYPRGQYDVDHMNRNAVGEFRCHLKVEDDGS